MLSQHRQVFTLFIALITLVMLPACGNAANNDAPAKTAVQVERTAAPIAQPLSPATEEMFKQLELFGDVFDRVRAEYVDEVPDKKMVENAINGMLTSLDPHSAFLNEEDFNDMKIQTRGEFGGLGIEITLEDKIVKIVSPIDDTPAAKAGLKPNDLITHIDGKLVTEMTLNEAVDNMRGRPGTKVTLTIRRGGISGEPFDVTLTRAIIKIVAVKSRIINNVGYIRITTFNEQTQTGLNRALNEIQEKLGDKLVGYVVDVRNNPGGLLDQAISVASTFLPAGTEVVATRGRQPQDNQKFFAENKTKAQPKPVVVLINNGSASASEIVAGALQDHKRGILLGTKSFGKGSVQTIIPVSAESAIRLTTARYYTPSGRSIQQSGIEPDIAVEPAKVEMVEQKGKILREGDLKGALKNDQQKEADQAKPANDNDGEAAKPNPDDPNQDYQLMRAIDLLRGVSLYEQRASVK